MDHELYAREGISIGNGDRPPFYKAVGIGLAIGSGLFIGVSFVMKKVGLLKANEKYNEIAGEGYGYLKNGWWWGGMILMIIGEICNFVAYAFTDAILVTPLGALSVVITTILSAIFLKERLSMVGKVACFLCIVGSVVIVMNAPHTSSVSNIEEMKDFFITPGFLSYAGVIIVGSVITAFWAGPKWGNKNMLVYISICSWVGGLSVVATQGLGAGIIAWIGGRPEYKEWFLWVLFAFVIATLLTEIIFLNKALNLFNAALVTPTYYVYFTSTTIITSAILFQGFKGSVESIVTVVLGFLTICSGVVLLQLSKSAKDVPDAAVFTGDLDQIQRIAEQEQPETEPKADAIRGTAAIVRRISRARMRMEAEELRRLHEEKMAEAAMESIGEGQPQYEWDGIRRRRTITMSTRSRAHSGATSPPPTAGSQTHPPHAHPPLGMSRFPDHDDEDDDRSTIFSSIAGTLRGRARTNATMPIYEEEYSHDKHGSSHSQPLPLTQLPRPHNEPDLEEGSYRSRTRPIGSSHGPPPVPPIHVQFPQYDDKDLEERPPAPPPHSAKRQFSFQRVFRREPTTGVSEEERAGLVGQDSDSGGESPQDSRRVPPNIGRPITGGQSTGGAQ